VSSTVAAFAGPVFAEEVQARGPTVSSNG